MKTLLKFLIILLSLTTLTYANICEVRKKNIATNNDIKIDFSAGSIALTSIGDDYYSLNGNVYKKLASQSSTDIYNEDGPNEGYKILDNGDTIYLYSKSCSTPITCIFAPGPYSSYKYRCGVHYENSQYDKQRLTLNISSYKYQIFKKVTCPKNGEVFNPKTNKCEPKCNVDKIQSGNYTFQDLADCVCKFGNDNPCSPHLEQAINNCQNSFSCSIDNVYKQSTPIAYKADENGKVWAYFKPIMCTDDIPETYNSINSIPAPNCKPTIPPSDDNKTEEPPKDNDKPDKPDNPDEPSDPSKKPDEDINDNPAEPKPDDGTIDINPKPKPKPNPDNPDKPSDPNNPPVPGDGNNKGDSDSPDDGDSGTNHSGGNGGGSSNNFDDSDIVNSINKTNELLEKESENIEKIKDRLDDLLDSDDYKDFDKGDLKSDIEESKGLLKKIKEAYDTIKEGLEKTIKEVKEQVVDIKRSIDNAVDKLKKPLGGSINSYKTCSCLYSKPLNLGFKTISVEIDPCEFICKINSVTYIVFFIIFFYTFLRFTIFALFKLF
ncbi:hypothetical protein [Campylobacter corcagiensis]|uniref:Uncharacterized protein n=1 Tax=Campylobacter corcagiensis TaxID=1448857 RepID=A0A7M1LGX8_9BACT|nr:hypothetical protein [Campylobacter corcagiensis]QKF64225.1 putative membrane protein [Campylobacter corcagiensis]QOQ87581.1 hypothetical protein IMC76_01865 [Campylobacter corcagiensis]